MSEAAGSDAVLQAGIEPAPEQAVSPRNRRDRKLIGAFCALSLMGMASGLAHVIQRRADSTGGMATASRVQVVTEPITIRSEEPSLVEPSPATPQASESQPDTPMPAMTTAATVARMETPAPAESAAVDGAKIHVPPAPIAAAGSVPAMPQRTHNRAGDLYLQIAAGTHEGARTLLLHVEQQGFTGRIIPGPTEQIVRVLVGPVVDAAALSQLKQEIEAAGYQNFIRRYSTPPDSR